jgi:hypothetical protein
MLSVYRVQRRMIEWLMSDEMDTNWKEAIVALFRYYPRIWFEVLRKDTKTPSQGSRYPSWDMNTAPIKYKHWVLSSD